LKEDVVHHPAFILFLSCASIFRSPFFSLSFFLLLQSLPLNPHPAPSRPAPSTPPPPLPTSWRAPRGSKRQIFSNSCGRYGTTRDYAQLTYDKLKELGIEDHALGKLLGLAGR
jgi:hypothetical protein